MYHGRRLACRFWDVGQVYKRVLFRLNAEWNLVRQTSSLDTRQHIESPSTRGRPSR